MTDPDFESAELFMRQAILAHAAGDEVRSIAARKMVAVALGIVGDPMMPRELRYVEVDVDRDYVAQERRISASTMLEGLLVMINIGGVDPDAFTVGELRKMCRNFDKAAQPPPKSGLVDG